MRYNLKDIESQLISTLQADTALAGVEIRTHAGEVNQFMFTNLAYWEGMVNRVPFIFIQYAGKTGIAVDDRKLEWKHELEFTFYIAASNLRATQEAQQDVYTMLGLIYDDIHGKWCNSSAQTLSSDLPKLLGTQITTALFCALTPIIESGGKDEHKIATLPKVALYQTSYKLMVLA